MSKTFTPLLAASALAAACAGAFAQSPAVPDAPSTQESSTTVTNPDGSTTTTVTRTVVTERIKQPQQPEGLTADQAHDLKTQSKADYSARKKISDANYDLNKADCEQSSSGSLYRACKADAKQQSKLDKADAKVIHESEKADIDANTK